MREIKFRAWDDEEKFMIDAEDFYFDSDEPLADLFSSAKYRYVLMQYVGIKDKNGKEIYEHDIVKTPAGYWGDNVIKANIGTIEYLDVEFIVNCAIPEYCQFNEFEVIGNIYENPELLENNT
jgi:uncharacterized phage protein (TIGR01671 family)